jgi:hypothetical protein
MIIKEQRLSGPPVLFCTQQKEEEFFLVSISKQNMQEEFYLNISTPEYPKARKGINQFIIYL